MDISDDGKMIAYSNGDILWLIGSDRTGERVLINGSKLVINRASDEETYISSIDWLPKHYVILFNTTIRVKYGYQGPNDLHQIDDVTGVHTILLQTGKGGMFVISPDGKFLAVSSENEIKILEPQSKRWYIALRMEANRREYGANFHLGFLDGS